MSNIPEHQSTERLRSEPTIYDEGLWKKYAQVYDEVLNVIPYQNLLLEIVDVAEIEAGMRIFDGCCGTGNLLWALREQNVQASVTEVDYSVDMLEKAKVKNYGGEVEFVRANLDLNISDWTVTGSFDRVILNNCLSFLADPAAMIKKVAAIARDDAILVASMPRPNPNISELLEQHLELSQNLGISREEALKRMMPKLQPIMKCNELLMKQYGDSYHLPSMPQLRGWFTDSGWTVTSLGTTYAGQNWLVTATKSR